MSQLTVVFPDGKEQSFAPGTSLLQVLDTLPGKVKRSAIAAEVDDQLVDLATTPQGRVRVKFITPSDPQGLEIMRHSTAHVMAQAVKHIIPEARFAIGPAIENGFYYDFDLPRALTPEDLTAIEEEMKRIVAEDYQFGRVDMDRLEALDHFSKLDEKYKAELIENLNGETVSLYRQGDFEDLCRGPHVPTTGKIGAFKLLSLAGAYWRGDSDREMLQRIYGTVFPTEKELKEYLTMMEEAARRDHRKLGRELDLFSLQEEGPGFPFYHPRGMVIRNILEDFWRQEHQKAGYQEIRTPMILNEELWHRSGHWDHYKENMYFTKIDDLDYAIKPMNCPGSMLVYKQRPHSYKDLPIRTCELGLVHRHEMSGVLHGLFRVRCFTQDDAHLFVAPEQIREEVQGVIKLVDKFYKVFGFEYHVELSTKPENAMGSDEIWELATDALRESLEDMQLPYKVNPGDGAFYGPKIDFHLRDSIGRTWQCATVQLDFQMPERFDLTYVGEDNAKHRPVIIHRVVYGSIERFFGILIEHHAGAFPVWLAPIQAVVLPIGQNHADYARQTMQALQEAGLRVELDARNEKLGYRIREWQMQKVPYMLVIGDQEAADGAVAVRTRKGGNRGTMKLEQFADLVRDQVNRRVINEESEE
ncbi:MAG TPA: threonine--tRNA ligase [Firmicutes bacterium]|jgi:threonyl-tRNA synthetase|nr:threonine--tRNA ligase [Bacillota bacterium]